MLVGTPFSVQSEKEARNLIEPRETRACESSASISAVGKKSEGKKMFFSLLTMIEKQLEHVFLSGEHRGHSADVIYLFNSISD